VINKKILCQQDNCAPDSLKYFNIKMEEITNLSVDEFIRISDKYENEFDKTYKLSKYVLEFSYDDQCYKLMEVERESD